MEAEPSLWDYLGFFAVAGAFFLSIFYIEALVKKVWAWAKRKN